MFSTKIVLVAFFATARLAQSVVTVQVELNPSSTSTIPHCTTSFLKALSAKLTSTILHATRLHEPLADFAFTQEMQIVDSHVRHRFLRALLPEECTPKCNSAACIISACVNGGCTLCGKNRRLLRSSLDLKWDEVGVDVTSLVAPLLKSFLLDDESTSDGCLGSPQKLGVNVTFV
jgi:hypothetical protein